MANTGSQPYVISPKSKYFTPDISSDGSTIVAVHNGPDGKSELHILDVTTGNLIRSIHSSEISVFTDPKFVDTGRVVTPVRLKDGKMALAMADLSTGNTTRLTSPSYNVIGYPCVNNETIYFTASYGGNDDIFALRLADKKIFRVFHGSTGNYFVNVAQGKMTWSEFTADGYQLRQLDEKDLKWVEMRDNDIAELKPAYPVSHANESEDILNTDIPQRNFGSEKYKKGTRLLNFHSWRPYYEDPEFTFSIYGENVLNTFQTELYYLYNENDVTNAVGLNAVYGALYPHISIGTEYTFDLETVVANRLRQWGQLDTRIGFNVPLNYASGKSYKSFNIGTNYVLRNEFNKGFFKDSIGNTSFSYLHHFIGWGQQIQSAVQHIYPHLGYVVNANHRYAITQFKGYQFIGTAAIYLPGFISTHNVILTGAFQQRDTLGQVIFSNRFGYSRGYLGRYFSRMWRLSANYHFPLWIPDWGFGNILYIQRIRANAFYDFTKVYSINKTQTRDQRSVGGEIFIDTRWWNQYPLTFGFRISHLLDPDQFDLFKGTIFEFVMPISIIPR
jgi:hypothetical protein